MVMQRAGDVVVESGFAGTGTTWRYRNPRESWPCPSLAAWCALPSPLWASVSLSIHTDLSVMASISEGCCEDQRDAVCDECWGVWQTWACLDPDFFPVTVRSRGWGRRNSSLAWLLTFVFLPKPGGTCTSSQMLFKNRLQNSGYHTENVLS